MTTRTLMAALEVRIRHVRFEVLPEIRGTLVGAKVERLLHEADIARRAGLCRDMNCSYRALKPYRQENA